MNTGISSHGIGRGLALVMAGAAALLAIETHAAGLPPDPEVMARIQAQGQEVLDAYRGQLPVTLAVASQDFMSRPLDPDRVLVADEPVNRPADDDLVEFCIAALSGSELEVAWKALPVEDQSVLAPVAPISLAASAGNLSPAALAAVDSEASVADCLLVTSHFKDDSGREGDSSARPAHGSGNNDVGTH